MRGGEAMEVTVPDFQKVVDNCSSLREAANRILWRVWSDDVVLDDFVVEELEAAAEDEDEWSFWAAVDEVEEAYRAAV